MTNSIIERKGAVATGEIVLNTPTDTFTSIVAGGGGVGDPANRTDAGHGEDG